MFPSRKLILLASVFAFLFSFNAGAATTSDPAVAELVRLLQDGSDYLMKMVAQSDPRVAEILLTKQTWRNDVFDDDDGTANERHGKLYVFRISGE